MEEKDPVLCGFVWCHGYKDFSAWEVKLPDDVIKQIELILEDYSNYGTSERNVYDSRIKDIFSSQY